MTLLAIPDRSAAKVKAISALEVIL